MYTQSIHTVLTLKVLLYIFFPDFSNCKKKGVFMPATKSASAVSAKWGRVTPQRSQDYQEGVENPQKDWEKNTKAAESNYASGVQSAIADKRFGKGVSKAGTSKWKEKTISKGVQRWGPGVQVAQGDYEKGMAPVLDVIGRTSLPPRFPSGDPRNIQRVQKLATALHNMKLGH